MTPEEIRDRLDSPAFIRCIFDLAATRRPDNPYLQDRHDAAVAIVTLSWDIRNGSPLLEKEKAELQLAEMMESYAQTYGQNPDWR